MFLSVDVFTHAEPQTTSPVGQLHLPLVHVAPVAHFVVQVPHAPVSLLRSRQPMVGPQSTCPVGQTHAPPTQEVPEGQTLPQLPQLFLSVVGSVQIDPPPGNGHVVFGAKQPLHFPLVQVSPTGHAAPHAPQFAGSLETSTHAVPHVTSPVLHAHTLAVHVCPVPHFVPHPPQLLLSLVVSVQVPGGAPQVVSPVGQVHVLATQLPPVAHALPHAPQLAGSVVGSMHAVPHLSIGGAHVVSAGVSTTLVSVVSVGTSAGASVVTLSFGASVVVESLGASVGASVGESFGASVVVVSVCVSVPPSPIVESPSGVPVSSSPVPTSLDPPHPAAANAIVAAAITASHLELVIEAPPRVRVAGTLRRTPRQEAQQW